MPDVNAQQAQRLINFATQRLGRVEGDGECWTLVNNGFQSVGFIKPASTYVWGRVVNQLSDAQPGDVFQFSQFRVAAKPYWRSVSRPPVEFPLPDLLEGRSLRTVASIASSP